jgi:hypothetical protein
MDKDDLTRDELIDLLVVVGGSGADLHAADDVTLSAIVLNRILAVTDASKLAAALAMPLTLEWRAVLTRRQIELDQIAKVPPRKPPTYPGLTVFIPPVLESMTHFIDDRGNSHETRIVDGKRVLDMSVAAFMAFLGGPHGLDWSRANEGTGVFERMNPGLHAN